MNDEPLITRAEMKALMEEAVHSALNEVGLGGDMMELQRDMVHLRRWRISVEAVSTTTYRTIAATIAVGILGALWLGITTMINPTN